MANSDLKASIIVQGGAPGVFICGVLEQKAAEEVLREMKVDPTEFFKRYGEKMKR